MNVTYHHRIIRIYINLASDSALIMASNKEIPCFATQWTFLLSFRHFETYAITKEAIAEILFVPSEALVHLTPNDGGS